MNYRDVCLYGLLFVIVAVAGCASKLSNKDTRWLGVQRIEYVTQGTGSPTVVFNSNTDMDSWAKVIPEVAEFTSVFADSRPGHGGSKPAMGENTGKRVVERLHRLLAETGQRPPVRAGRALLQRALYQSLRPHLPRRSRRRGLCRFVAPGSGGLVAQTPSDPVHDQQRNRESLQ